MMKTKSVYKLNAENDPAEKVNDFLKFYKSAAESNISIKGGTSKNKLNDTDDSQEAAKRRHPRHKVAKKKFQGEAVNLSKIDINGPNLASDMDKLSPLNDSKVTSTPNVKKNKDPNIKPIIKDTSIIENVDISNVSEKKPKKRNKSVSFMLEDNEEVTIKKTKSDDALVTKNQDVVKNKLKKNKRNQVKVKEDKENNEKCSDTNIEMKNNEVGKNKRRHSGKKANLPKDVSVTDHEMAGGDAKTTPNVKADVESDKNMKERSTANNQHENEVQKKKRKKIKKQKTQNVISNDNESTKLLDTNTTEQIANNDTQKKKRKRGKKQKPQDSTENESIDTQKFTTDTQCENTNDVQKKKKRKINKKQKPESANKQDIVIKSKKSKTEAGDTSDGKNSKKPDMIAKGIENLNIGDNAHTLTNLLNGISVNKTKKKKNKAVKSSEEKSENANTEEQSPKKKVRKNKSWKKKRNLNAVVLVQNLPFSILLNYRQVLREHFSKFGKVHSVGIADLKCDKSEAKPIFTTRVFFTTEEAAASALTADKSEFEGNTIRVKKFESPVARTYKPGTWAKNPFRPHKTKPSEDKEEINDKDFCEKFDHDSDSV